MREKVGYVRIHRGISEMFTSEDVLAHVRKQPFTPIRFVTSAGQHYDVYHPEMVMVGRRDVHVGTESKENPAIHDKVAFLSLLHITAIEPIPPKGKRSHGAKRSH